jgi:hypothetical protein
MSIVTEIMLFCDGGTACKLDSAYSQDAIRDGKVVTPASLRANACHEGWVRVGRKDYCGSCAERLGLSSKEYTV